MSVAAHDREPDDRPIRYAQRVTLLYLLLTIPLLWRDGGGLAQAALSVAHAGAAGILWLAGRTRSRAVAIGDWLPLALVPLLYAELPYLMGTDVVYRDGAVQEWEAALFGSQPASTLAASLPFRALSELLHLGYLSYYAIIYVPPLVLYLAGRRAAFGRAVLASMSTYAVCFLTFAIFPVEGPRYVWPAPAAIPDGPVRALALAILERGSSRGTAFPSSHVAIAVAQTVVTFRHDRGLGLIVGIASLLLMVGAVYGGFHYAVDIVVGAAVGFAIGATVTTRFRAGPEHD